MLREFNHMLRYSAQQFMRRCPQSLLVLNHTLRNYAKSRSPRVPSAVSKRGKQQGHPEHSNQIHISKTISWLLRHGAEKQGIAMRKDGYVPVQDLLSHPELRGVDILILERIVKGDDKKRFHLLFEPRTSNMPGSSAQANIWWIRANQGHSLPAVELNLTSIDHPQQVKMAVHGTTLQAWELIATQGLSRMGRNHIHLAQGISGVDVISGIAMILSCRPGIATGMRSSSEILIFIDLKKALDAGIKFYLSSNGVVLTKGNELGVLEPRFFSRVERVTTERRPVSGWEGPIESETTPT